MKKVLFWFLTDVIWFVLYIPTMYSVLNNYLHTLHFTGDSRMVYLFDIIYFVLINTVFVLIQNIGTLIYKTNTERDLNRYLKFKQWVFVVHVVMLNLINTLVEGLSFFLGHPKTPEWLWNLSLCIIIPIILYSYIIRKLGKKVK